MSYCRFSECDVYMYFHYQGFITCRGCCLGYGEHPKFFNYQDAIDHIKEHIKDGDKVAKRAIPALVQEMEDQGNKDFRLKPEFRTWNS